MTGLPKAEWWEAALLGGFVSGLVGPGIGFVVEMRFLFPFFYLPWLWLWAIVAVGPPAFVLGCVGGILLKVLGAMCPTMRVVTVMALALGIALGSAVAPFGVFVLGWGAKEKGALGFVVTGAVTGLICAFLTLWLLRRRGLLHLSHQQAEMPSLDK